MTIHFAAFVDSLAVGVLEAEKEKETKPEEKNEEDAEDAEKEEEEEKPKLAWWRDQWLMLEKVRQYIDLLVNLTDYFICMFVRNFWF